MNHRTARSAATAAALAAGLACLTAPSALADDVREQELEDRVRSLESQLEEMRERMDSSATGGGSTELESRVAELEELTKKNKDGLFTYWKTGIRMDSANKRFKFKIGGRIMVDFLGWDSDRDTEAVVGEDLETGAEMRRARLYMAGTIYNNVDFKAEWDFTEGDATFKDMYMALRALEGKFIVGHHYEPFGHEVRTSSKYITFMERSPVTIFSPDRNTGLSYKAQRDELWYSLGIFREADNFGDDEGNTGSGEWNGSARVSYRPLVNEDDQQYVNVGGSVSYRNYDDETVRFRARPEVHNAPRFVDTMTFAAEDGLHLGADAAFVHGPFHVVSEWGYAEVDASGGQSDPTFWAWSIETGYFITGESRPFKGGNFARVKPKKNYGEAEADGWGALQVAARFSTIDLNDEGIRGGEMDTVTVGVNWHLNPMTRVMLNWVWIDLDRRDATRTISADQVSAFMVRFQIDW